MPFQDVTKPGNFTVTAKKSFQQTPLRSPDVLDTFGRLGNDEPQIKTNLTKFEKFILKKKKNKPILCPLTLVALKKKVSRAYYITIQWKSANINSSAMPDPNDYGWLFNEKDQFQKSIECMLLALDFIANWYWKKQIFYVIFLNACFGYFQMNISTDFISPSSL